MGNEKEEQKASIHNQNYRLVGITYNGITHVTGKLTLNIFRNSKQGKRKSVQKQSKQGKLLEGWIKQQGKC